MRLQRGIQIWSVPHGFRLIALFVLSCAVTLAAGCGMPALEEEAPQLPGEEVGPGGRRQPSALSPRQELAVGRRAFQQVMNEYRARLLPQHSPEVARTQVIAARLIRAAEIEPLQREILLRVQGYRFEWEVNVIQERQVNAFCLPAGKIFLFTGILEVAGGREDYLATVLSHEIAHALAHHASERVAREQSGEGVLRSLSYSRMQESEADHIGVFLMAFAGYDPHQAVRFWERMERVTDASGRTPEMLSDHPTSERRIRDLRKWAPEAQAAKRAFDEGRIAPPPSR
jgi:metalloendopeptidase OMA1, mitochondrial